MASKHHKIIPKLLNDLIKDYPCLKKVRCLKLNDPNSKKVIEYMPDYIIKRDISSHSYYFVIFEIIDRQPDVKTIADICRIIAKPEIKKAIFISCSKKKKEETDRLISVIVGNYKDRFNKRNNKEILDISSREINAKDNEETISNLIYEELKIFLPKVPKT